MSTRQGVPRLAFLDATRGFAMLFVCLSHFGTFYLDRADAPELESLTRLLGYVATPSFMLVSGVLLGLFAARQAPKVFAQTRWRMLDRALFLLTIGHAVIAAAHLPLQLSGQATAALWLFVTDAIALSMALGVFLVPRLGSRGRLLLGLAVLCVSWVAAETWSFNGAPLDSVVAVLFGAGPPEGRLVLFPLMPWFGVYLLGTSLGTSIASWQARGLMLWRRLAPLGLASMVAGGSLRPAWLLAQGLFALPNFAGLHRLSSPLQRWPPSPAHLLVYGGAGVLVLAIMQWAEGTVGTLRAYRLLARVGRGSLLVFFTQYFVYQAGFFVLHLPYSPAWPLYLLGSVVLSCLPALWWGQSSSQFITVGLPRLASWLRVRLKGASPQLSSAGK